MQLFRDQRPASAGASHASAVGEAGSCEELALAMSPGWPLLCPNNLTVQISVIKKWQLRAFPHHHILSLTQILGGKKAGARERGGREEEERDEMRRASRRRIWSLGVLVDCMGKWARGHEAGKRIHGDRGTRTVSWERPSLLRGRQTTFSPMIETRLGLSDDTVPGVYPLIEYIPASDVARRLLAV